MKGKPFIAAMLATALLFTVTACGKTQLPEASDKTDSAAQQTGQQNDEDTSANEHSSASGDDASEGESVLTDAEEGTEDDPWKTALAEDLFEKYGVLPEYYEDLGDGIYQVYVEVGGEVVPFVTVDSATGDYHG